MRVFLFVGLLALASAYVSETNTEHLINHINSLDTTWKAGHSSTLHRRLGLLPTPENLKNRPRERRAPEGFVPPESFDAREQWPFCPTIPVIQDQGDCGSCWAVAAVTVMSDRACIHSNGTENFVYSIENLISCCHKCGSCAGGFMGLAFDYWVDTGICSGGPYGSNEGCQPYSIEPTGYGQKMGSPTPHCSLTCREGYEVPYLDDLRFGIDHTDIPQDQKEIQHEIMTNGPVEVGFDVYEDFDVYESGVYQHTEGTYLGGHAVRMIGWGVENDVPYWICANSWNTSWGEKGFFKILRGSNECGIEEDVNAGTPKPL